MINASWSAFNASASDVCCPAVSGGRPNAGIPIEGYGRAFANDIPIVNAAIDAVVIASVFVKTLIILYILFNCFTNEFLFLIMLLILAEEGQLINDFSCSGDRGSFFIIACRTVAPNAANNVNTNGINDILISSFFSLIILAILSWTDSLDSNKLFNWIFSFCFKSSLVWRVVRLITSGVSVRVNRGILNS